MKRPKIYLAGPDLFKSDAVAIYDAYNNSATKLGLELLYPSDDIVEQGNSKLEFATNIFRANERMLHAADAVLVNLEPFRGPCMDVGAAFEIGFARALGKPIFGFYPRAVKDYFSRLKQHHRLIDQKDGLWRSEEGLLLEDFGLSDNLMIALGITGGAHRGFDSALKAAAEHIKDSCDKPIYELPAREFPQWLYTFDRANDQHSVSLKVASFLLSALNMRFGKKLAGRMFTLQDMACGDGRFSKSLIDHCRSRLKVEIEYSGVDIDTDAIDSARTLFPQGKLTIGNIFEDLEEHVGATAPDVLLFSHCVYFATDKAAFAKRLSQVINPKTIILFLVNDPIHRPITPDVQDLIAALEEQNLPHLRLPEFESFVHMPQNADVHINQLMNLQLNAHADEDFLKTIDLLSFCRQTPLHALSQEERHELLSAVRLDMRTYNGRIPMRNHLVIAVHRDFSQRTLRSVKATMNEAMEKYAANFWEDVALRSL